MSITILSLVNTIMVLRMHHHDGKTRMSGISRAILFSCLAPCIRRRSKQFAVEPVKQDQGVRMDNAHDLTKGGTASRDSAKKYGAASGDSPVNYEEEWKEGAQILENFAIYIIFVLLITSTVACIFIVPPVTNQS